MFPIIETNLPNLFYRGKVRDTYRLGNGKLLFIATDRVSALDFVLPNGIPYKGIVLNLLSAFWFEKTSHIVPNHFVKVVKDVSWFNKTYNISLPPRLAQRSMIVKEAERLPIESIVRGYLSGSAWAEYSEKGTIAGVQMPKGLQESEKLPEILFTPTTKADSGHDIPISKEEVKNIVGESLALQVEKKSIEIYCFAEKYAEERGIIVADTKTEFGIIDGELHLIDELLTPDSSRFWDAESYCPGGPQPSFDKQPIRDWLAEADWNRKFSPPPLPQRIVEETSNCYREVLKRLTGTSGI
jgi:phosphoribosylaminoimidazole-succinocarboxamide synthase